MIVRHVTTHDEHGARLLGVGRAIYRKPPHSALDALAIELAARGRCAAYSQRRLLEGAVLSKTYPCNGRTIVDSVYFSTLDELKGLYMRGPLGNGLFFDDAPWLDSTFALPPLDIAQLNSSAAPDEFAGAVRALFPDVNVLAEVVCALRTGRFPLAIIGDMAAGDLSRKLFMALQLMLRALPLDVAINMEYSTVVAQKPCNGVNGYTMNDYDRSCSAYIYLTDSTRDLDVEPSKGDFERAEALLSGTYSRVTAARDAADDPVEAIPAVDARDAAPDVKLTNADLERAQQALSASLRYANSADFRRFTAGFIKLRRTLGSDMYFRYALMYSDYLHRIGHPMYELYDAELASLYNEPPAGLLSSQIARTISGYPGALRGTLRHIERAGTLERFVTEAMPGTENCARLEEYPARLVAARNTLLSCLPPSRRELVTGAMAEAANREMSAATPKATAEALLDVRDALEALMRDEPALNEGVFDPLLSELIERIDFNEFDEYDERTYDALDYAYSYVRQWDGQVTDNQRAVCLWGRLMSGYGEWGGSVMQGVLKLLSPMEPPKRDAFLRFGRRYFAALCDGGLERAQMSESVVIITTLAALRFDSRGEWNLNELDDVLDRLDAAGEGLEREYWQQISTRVDLMPVDMLNEALSISGQRAESSLRTTMSRQTERPREPRHDSASRRADDADEAEAPEDAEAEPMHDESRRTRERTQHQTRQRNRAAETQHERRRSDDEARYRAHSREYDARLAPRSSARGEREGDSRCSRRSRSYDYESDDDDGGQDILPISGRRFSDTIARYKSSSYAPAQQARGISGDTLALIALLMLFAGAAVFCVITFVL